MRQERKCRPLAFERAAPASGQLRRASRTGAMFGEPILLNQIAVAGNQALAALLAVCVLEIADAPWQIPGIHIPQSLFTSDACGADQHGRSEERRVGKECRSRWSPY